MKKRRTIVLVISISLIFLFACSPNSTDLAKQYAEIYNTHDVKKIISLYAPDAVFEVVGQFTLSGKEQIRNLTQYDSVLNIQMSLFDETNLAEISSSDYPGERLIACFNPLLAEDRRRTRDELLDATEKELEKIARAIARRKRKLLKKDEIGLRVGRIINRYKVAKHFRLTIEDNMLSWERRETSIARETALDGLYVIRTSESQHALSAEDAVRSYKNLAQVERVFRTFKGLDIRIRPIHHRTEERVRAHIFICLLAYYVEWHLRRVLAPLLFDDEALTFDRKQRDPVAPAEPSIAAKNKKVARTTEDGLPIHSFTTLLAEMGTRCRHRCRVKSDPACPPLFQDTDPTPLQTRALELTRLLPVQGI